MGCAEAGPATSARHAGPGARFEADEVVYCSTGDGTTSEGEFWESLNTACNRKLPVLYLVEDNGYAISVPVEVQTAGGSISKLVRSFPNLLVREVDGCDPLASLAVLREAAAWCRARRGPALVHAQRDPALLALALRRRDALPRRRPSARPTPRRDPLVAFPRFLRRGRAWPPRRSWPRCATEVDREVNAAADAALAAARPRGRRAPPATSTRPTSTPPRDAFRTEPQPAGDPKTMVDLLNACLHDEMARDPRIVVFGEDVADCSREESLDRGQGQGRRLQGHPQPAAQVRLGAASSTRRWPRPTSWAAPSAWPPAA